MKGSIFECLQNPFFSAFAKLYCIIVLYVVRDIADLARVVSLLASRAEAAGWQDEDLLRDRVDLPDALVVVHHRDVGLADAEGDRAGCSKIKGHRSIFKVQMPEIAKMP